jgi:hypothetical protein
MLDSCWTSLGIFPTVDEMKIDQLHDATLEKIEIDWPARTCQITVHAYKVRWLIHVNAFSSVVVPRSEPWGRSKSINTVVQSEDGLDIEMQSGDMLVFRGSIQISKTPGENPQ